MSQFRQSRGRRDYSNPSTSKFDSAAGSLVAQRRPQDLISSLDLNDENDGHHNSILAMSQSGNSNKFNSKFRSRGTKRKQIRKIYNKFDEYGDSGGYTGNRESLDGGKPQMTSNNQSLSFSSKVSGGVSTITPMREHSNVQPRFQDQEGNQQFIQQFNDELKKPKNNAKEPFKRSSTLKPHQASVKVIEEGSENSFASETPVARARKDGEICNWERVKTAGHQQKKGSGLIQNGDHHNFVVNTQE